MQKNKLTYLAETLERLPTGQLDDLLNKELESENPNGQNVRLILKILHKREETEDAPLNQGAKVAWAEYLMETGKTQPEPERKGKRLLKIAAVVIVTVLLFALLPQKTSARSILERFITWTDSILMLNSEEDSASIHREYIFATENPGLQQVYDAVAELGVTKPVVPMWLPEGYELIECKVTSNPAKTAVVATFSNGKDDISLRINQYLDNVSSEYYKNEEIGKSIELAGICHMITQNETMLVAVWVQENIECSIAIDCQEDDLINILKTIYTMEAE